MKRDRVCNSHLVKNASGIDVAFSASGLICTGCQNDSHLKIWNLTDDPYSPKVYDIVDTRLGKFRRKYYENVGISRLAMRPNSNLLAIGSMDGGAYLLNTDCEDVIDSPHILRVPREMSYLVRLT